MKISKERFQALVGAYLDDECSPEETQLLLDCIKADNKLRSFFLRSCAMHKTMCKLYGKEAKFPPLASVNVEKLLSTKKVATMRTAIEWVVVALLFIISATLLFTLFYEKHSQENAQEIDSGKILRNYKTELCSEIDSSDGDACIIKITPKHSVIAP
jgi:hypothetical protein